MPTKMQVQKTENGFRVKASRMHFATFRRSGDNAIIELPGNNAKVGSRKVTIHTFVVAGTDPIDLFIQELVLMTSQADSDSAQGVLESNTSDPQLHVTALMAQLGGTQQSKQELGTPGSLCRFAGIEVPTGYTVLLFAEQSTGQIKLTGMKSREIKVDLGLMAQWRLALQSSMLLLSPKPSVWHRTSM